MYAAQAWQQENRGAPKLMAKFDHVLVGKEAFEVSEEGER